MHVCACLHALVPYVAHLYVLNSLLTAASQSSLVGTSGAVRILGLAAIQHSQDFRGEVAVLGFGHRMSPAPQMKHAAYFKADGRFIFRFGGSAVAHQAK